MRIIAICSILVVLVWALLYFVYPAIQELIPPPESAVEERA